MEIVKTIIPIFAVIFLGFLAKNRKVITDSFLAPANRLTFYFAIPALIFRAVAKSDFISQFNGKLLAGTLLPMVLVYLVSWTICSFLKVNTKQRGTLIESTMHGNVGYIGFAVVFYYLGQEALATAAIIGAFMFLIHNVLAVIVLQVYSEKNRSQRGAGQTLVKIVGNPIIVTSVFSIFFSLSPLEIPIVIDRTLSMLANMALPLALLVIGASLSFKIQSRQLLQIAFVCSAKLLVLPAMGFVLYHLFYLESQVYLPGLILLACPAATVVYILAVELKGDTQLAINIISATTALSAVTISFWLKLTL